MDIKVLVPGCPKCQQTEKIVKEAVAEEGVDAQIEKVDGEVKSVGKIPKKQDVIGWINL